MCVCVCDVLWIGLAVRDLCLSAGQWRSKAVHVENVFELEN